jgi:hypothetical protein
VCEVLVSVLLLKLLLLFLTPLMLLPLNTLFTIFTITRPCIPVVLLLLHRLVLVLALSSLPGRREGAPKVACKQLSIRII